MPLLLKKIRLKGYTNLKLLKGDFIDKLTDIELEDFFGAKNKDELKTLYKEDAGYPAEYYYVYSGDKEISNFDSDDYKKDLTIWANEHGYAGPLKKIPMLKFINKNKIEDKLPVPPKKIEHVEKIYTVDNDPDFVEVEDGGAKRKRRSIRKNRHKNKRRGKSRRHVN